MGALRHSDIEEFYRLLDVEVADFDCGAICARRNRSGVPYCCDISKTVPLLYHEELDYVRRHTRMWRIHKPTNSHEEFDELEYHVYAECRGPERCERRWRSIVCRIFPTYPYMDENARAIGLFFNTVLRDRCFLVERPELIRPAFVRSHLAFWNLLFERHAGEKEFHAQLCRQTEARYRRLRKPFVVMMPNGTLTRHYENGDGAAGLAGADGVEETWTPR
jgi:hypothetical protein